MSSINNGIEPKHERMGRVMDMNKEPELVLTAEVTLRRGLTCDVLLRQYDGYIDNSCIRLLADEWSAEWSDEVKQIRIRVFRGFTGDFNVHKFAFGFEKNVKAFRQATTAELLALGVGNKRLGLDDFVYCLGSAHINPKETIACGMVDPLIFNPGLECMDGKRQMLCRAIRNPWFERTQVALVEL